MVDRVRVVTLALVILLVQLWSAKNQTEIETFQLTDQRAVDEFLDANWQSRRAPDDAQRFPPASSFSPSDLSLRRTCT